jgi:alkanesulfonate monooxygenase
MPPELRFPGIRIFSTCPPSSVAEGDAYLARVTEAAQWSEEAGCEGMLIYTDNSLVDPWLVSQVVLTRTRSLCPLIAVQPVYMHPYSVAKMVASLGMLHRRRVYLNMVAGGFKNDLIALNDTTPHDQRYARLEEYCCILFGLLRSADPVTFAGQFYTVTGLRLAPPLRPELMPGLLLSGSSEAGLATARRLNAVAVQYPEPPEAYQEGMPGGISDGGIRVGVLARPTEDEAWEVALERFPVDRKGQLARQMATQVSDSAWHHQLSHPAPATRPESPYWLIPFQNYKTNCPYLVGSYDRVGEELGRYLRLGHRTFILDIPPSREELRHTGQAYARAVHQMVA